jgi:hypothetical protein
MKSSPKFECDDALFNIKTKYVNLKEKIQGKSPTIK